MSLYRGIIIDKEYLLNSQEEMFSTTDFLSREFSITVLSRKLECYQKNSSFLVIEKIFKNTNWERFASFLVTKNITANKLVEDVGINIASDLIQVKKAHESSRVYTSVENLCAKIKSDHINRRIVFSNGVFDLLHVGHLKTLNFAKKKGEILIVGINSDKSATNIKRKPVNPQYSRAELLASLKPVDYVIVFDELNPLEVIHALKPSVLVKGSDYKISEVVGASYVQKHGGKVISAPLLPGVSSTKILTVARCRPYKLC